MPKLSTAPFFLVAGIIGTCLSVTPVSAASPYQCESGPNDAIVAACGARWEASNIRAHVAAGDLGGATAECLNKTALLLESLAVKYVATNKVGNFNGSWPCGREPKIAKADDGALATACHGKSWTYRNQGKVACNMQIASTTAQATQATAAPKDDPCPKPMTPVWALYWSFQRYEQAYIAGNTSADVEEGTRRGAIPA